MNRSFADVGKLAVRRKFASSGATLGDFLGDRPGNHLWNLRGKRCLAAAGVVLTMATGCSTAAAGSYGSDYGTGTTADQGTSAKAATGTASYNEADVRFSQQMIPHHWQSIHVAALVADRSNDDYVRSLAKKIAEEEGAEIKQMSGWLRTWKVAVPSEKSASGHDMEGMLSQAQITALEGRTGTSFDKLWLTSLAKHLDNGVAMAQKALDDGEHKGTRDLAQKIVTGQKAEIAEITRHLA